MLKLQKKLSNRVLAAVILFAVLLCTAITFLSAKSVLAASETETSYSVVIEDDADLLTSTEESNLKQVMQPLTEYGNILFKTISNNTSGNAETYAGNYYYSKFGNDSGTVLLIDMDLRKIAIVSTGSNYNIITKAKATTITDNIYTYASAGNYYDCAAKAYSQILVLLQGGAIAEPMRYITSALIAIALAMLIFFVIITCKTKIKMPGRDEIFNAAVTSAKMGKMDVQFTSQSRKYSPVQTSGGGGGGGGFSGGGGGGGGGGFSGGGGSHSF